MANDTKYGYLISPAPQFLDTNGKPISGGRLKVYIAGTTTKATTYSNWNLTKNTWPVVLDAMGTCQVIVSSAELYKFVLESAEGEEPLVTRDNVAVAYANVDITGIGSEVVNFDGSVDVTATTAPDTGRTTYDVSVKDTVQNLEGLIQDEIDRAKTAEKAAKTEVVAGDNITVTKTVGADGQDVYTVSGEDGDSPVEDVRVNGTSVVTDKVANIDVPVAGTASPLMDGTASVGASGKFAREDHVHPTDTSREPAFSVLPVTKGGTGSGTASGARTNLDVYSKSETDSLMNGKVVIVSTLPVTGESGKIYYVGPSGSGADQYEEYLWDADNAQFIKVGERSIDLSNYKTKQTAVNDPTASGTGLEFIATASQNANGEMSVTKKTIQDGTTSQKGAVQLEDSVSSTSTTKAATPKSVKTAYDLANAKMDKQTAGNGSTPIYLNNGVATPCGILTGNLLSYRIIAGNSQGIFKVLSVYNSGDLNKGGVIVPWVGRTSAYPYQGELHICTTAGGVTNWKNASYNMFFSNFDNFSRHQFYIAANTTGGIDIYVVLQVWSLFAWAPTATVSGVTYYNQRVDALPEDAVQLTDRVNASLSAWSVGSASTPVYFKDGVAEEATDVASGKADKVANATAGNVATLDANGNLVDSGKTLGTNVPADADFTDDKVAQMKADSSDTAYPLLMAGTADPRGGATVARYDSSVTLNPSTNTIAANISGNAATADSATTAATADRATTAARATVLASPRNIHVNLESNTGANFNGSANIMPGVTGVLPQIFGGTGYNTVDTAPVEGSNKMVTSGGVWNFSAPANLGILTGSSVNVNNDFDDFDRFAVLVTSAVRLRTYWLIKKSGRVIAFYNLNDYEITVDIVIEIGQTVVFHRQAARDVTWTNSGSTTSAQTLCSLSYKGYVKFYVTYDSESDQFDIYQNSNFAYLTGNVTTSMIGNVGTSGTSDSRTGMIYHNDIVCNHSTGNYAINVERLVVGQVYRFQFLTKTGYTYLYNNGTSNVTVYTGNTSFTLGPGWNANIQASSSAVASHTVSVVRMSATLVYIIWGY